MLDTGVRAVGEERGESSWGNLGKREKVPPGSGAGACKNGEAWPGEKRNWFPGSPQSSGG